MSAASPSKAAQQAELQQQLLQAERLLRIQAARDDLIEYTRLTMPHPDDKGDGALSKYRPQQIHRVIAEQLEKVERGDCMRMLLSVPPQHGKSELAKRLIAWISGKHPHKHIIFGTYSQDFARRTGGQVRSIMSSDGHKQVFEDHGLQQGSKSKDEMVTTDGGELAFIGRNASGSGRPADVVVIDDPLKNDKEAQSPTIREEQWEWFTKVIYARCHVMTSIIIIHTRWHEDDLIGRLTDKDNPNYDPEIAADWTYINLPAIVEDAGLAKALGIEKGSSLWPERFPVKHLESARRLNPRGFSALYMGKPSPDDGIYFKAENLLEYNSPADIPSNLRKFASSDHAVTEKQQNDPSCLGVWGIDENQHLWLLPDVFWDRVETDVIVEEMIALMKRHKPQLWWAEDEHISKSIGPFLRNRQKAERVYTTVMPVPTENKDLMAKARSFQGMTALKMVHFPKFAPWWGKARAEMLKFPAATHDDFVSMCAQMGAGLDHEFGAQTPGDQGESKIIRVGSLAWVKAASDREKNEARYRRAAGGM